MTTSGGKNSPAAGHKRFHKLQRKLERWLDEWRIASVGIVLSTKNPKFLLVFALTFIIFGTILNLLSGSTAAFSLFWEVGLPDKLHILLQGFLGIFGFGRNFWDWLFLFSITIIQSTLIALVALVWRKHRRNRAAQVAATAANADSLQNAGLVTGLAILGTGCPTCGTTLLAPLLGALFSTSSYALAGAISSLLTAAAVIVALLTMKRLGNDAYAMIISEKRRKEPLND